MITDALTNGAERLQREIMTDNGDEDQTYAEFFATDPGVKALVAHVTECTMRDPGIKAARAALKLWEQGRL